MMKAKRIRPIHWLFELLERDSGFQQRRLFSLDAAYLDNRLYLAFGDEPNEAWNGLMICTEQKHHASLREEFPQLSPHKALHKWLRLPQSHPEFESVAEKLVELARKRDSRLGVTPKRKTGR